MHVNGSSHYKTYDTPPKRNLVVKQDIVGMVRSSKEENQVQEDLNLDRIFSKLNRGEELSKAEINYVRMHDVELYGDISWLYALRSDVLATLASVSFEEATLFMKREKEELSNNLHKAYKEGSPSRNIRILEWYYSLLDKVWYEYLKQREGKIRNAMNGKIA